MEEKNFMLKLGNLYIESVSVDGYDSEINVKFTNDIRSAHNFKEEDNAILIKNMVESFLQSTFVLIIKENDDNND